MDSRGFTLFEVIFVMATLCILSSVALSPSVSIEPIETLWFVIPAFMFLDMLPAIVVTIIAIWYALSPQVTITKNPDCKTEVQKQQWTKNSTIVDANSTTEW